jgi:hypothetical protein
LNDSHIFHLIRRHNLTVDNRLNRNFKFALVRNWLLLLRLNSLFHNLGFNHHWLICFGNDWNYGLGKFRHTIVDLSSVE